MNIDFKYYFLFIIILVLPVAFSCKATVVGYRIIPLPKEIKAGDKNSVFKLTSAVKIVYPSGNEKMKKNAGLLAGYIKESTGMSLDLSCGDYGKNKCIVLSSGLPAANKEAYRLSIDKNHIRIDGASEAGTFYGIQALRKSLPVAISSSVNLPAVEINDYPRFSYRGAMLDVCRHFFTIDEVKQFIDMMALHNLNTFHWHLSDDQGWRIEIKKYPELQEKSSVRKETVIGRLPGKWDGTPHGGFYTQDEAKEVVAYAAERHINVIPEIDMPGHMRAALAAYPSMGCTGGPYEVWTEWGVTKEVLCAGNDSTIRFIDGVLTEIMDIFPSKYINVGGDECPKTRWKECPKCQARIKALGLKADDSHTAEDYLQSYVMNEAYRILSARGRKMIGWDDILDGSIPGDVTVMSWRGIKGGIKGAKKGCDVIMAPNTHLYFDYYQSHDRDKEPFGIGGYVPIERVYELEPVPSELTPAEAGRIIGVQANLWTEYILDFAHVQYMELPRMAALSEVQWCGTGQKDFEQFKKRMPALFDIYDNAGYNYARHLFDITASYIPDNMDKTINVQLTTLEGAGIHYTLDGSEPTEKSELYKPGLKINSDRIIKAVVIRKNGNSRVMCDTVSVNKATACPVRLLTQPDGRYTYNGATTLVDGINGNGNYRTGRWIGFYGNDMEAVIDLGKPTSVSSAGFACVMHAADGVADARGIEIYTSDDGENYTKIAGEDYPAQDKSQESGVSRHDIVFPETSARYVKIKVQSERELPAWNPFAGSPGFLFIDEIILD